MAAISPSKTFLQLCQLTREKCGISGSGPLTTVGQTGEYGRVVNWVNEAYLEIQNANETWDWMKGDFSFQTVVGQQGYTPAQAGITDFQTWFLDTLRCYNTSLGTADEQFVVPWPYERFRNFYQFQQQPQARPVVAAIDAPTKSLLLGNTPDQVYTIRGKYQKYATYMGADTDVPILPVQYHMLIVYGAMRMYALYENAPEVMAGANVMYDSMYDRLMLNQAEDIRFGDPLA